MRYARIVAIVLCLAAWAWFGWYYAVPTTLFFFEIMVQRQGLALACVSAFLALNLLTWAAYNAVMNLKRPIDAGTAPWPVELLGYATVLPPAIALDWILNVVLSVVTFDPPAWWGELVTGRLKRYVYEPAYHATWRQKFARGYAVLLDCLDPSGRHV